MSSREGEVTWDVSLGWMNDCARPREGVSPGNGDGGAEACDELARVVVDEFEELCWSRHGEDVDGVRSEGKTRRRWDSR